MRLLRFKRNTGTEKMKWDIRKYRDHYYIEWEQPYKEKQQIWIPKRIFDKLIKKVGSKYL